MINVNKIFDMEKEIVGKSLKLADLPKDKTVVIFVDMVVGFVYKGTLASPRVVGIVNTLVDLNEKTREYRKVFFLDEHKKGCVEHNSYAEHCLEGTEEAELINELKSGLKLQDSSVLIPKNSINGFHAPGFKQWLENNEDIIKNYIVVGCCTDLCVENFVMTLKTYFDQKNLNKRIVVPINGVETFDFGTHDGSLMNIISLWKMKSNGVEVVDIIE